MITPRKVFGYSAAATAGYVVTADIIAWMMSVGKTLLYIAILAVIGAISSVVAWFGSTRPIDSKWALIYLGICLFVLAMSGAPLVIGGRFLFRYLATANDDEGKP